MVSLSRYNIMLVVGYYITSKLMFDIINKTVQIVGDEYYHIPQGLSYCKFDFSDWDPKITTLPGLYLVSSIIGLFFECNTYNLRFVNLIASCVNLMLFTSIFKSVYNNEDADLMKIIQALNLAQLPPLYFFSHVYYTDTLSLTFLLMFLRLCLTYRYLILILICGISSIIVRQTNVVWIAMVFGHKLLDLIIKSPSVFGNQHIINDVKLSKQPLIAKDLDKPKLKRYYGMWDLYCAVKYHLSTKFTTLFKFITFHDATILLTHMIILSGFIVLVYINGSIVVGDKTAHEATIHLPQLLYFLVFYGVFGLPHVVNKFSSTLKLMYRERNLVLLCGVIFTLIVHYNTVVHPYLLTDSGHYTFNIWNRWYGKYDHAIYTMVPIYIFLLFSLYDNLRGQICITFLLPYTFSLVLALALQSLIEIRYFTIPYILLKLRFPKPPYQVVVLEFLWYSVINSTVLCYFLICPCEGFDHPQSQLIMWYVSKLCTLTG